MNISEMGEQTQRALTKRKFAFSQWLSAEMMDGLTVEVAPSVAEYMVDSAIVQLRGMIYGERVQSATAQKSIQIPATAWDMWKRDHAPTWFTAKYGGRIYRD